MTTDVCDAIPYIDIPNVCNRCGKNLKGRQTAWCGMDCSEAFAREHDWNLARRAARRRDGEACVQCGGDGSDQRPSRPDVWELFDRRQAARELGIELPVGEFVRVRRTRKLEPWLEVNHIDPRVGRGYGWGCHNHLSNLETLCHDCHVVVTRTQKQQRQTVRAVERSSR